MVVRGHPAPSETEKQLRKLGKQLREMETLQARLDSGEVLERNQMEKLNKKAAVEQIILDLNAVCCDPHC